MSKKLYISFIIVMVSMFFGSFTYAQIRNTDIVLSINPTNPGPNQNATAELSSFAIDLDKTYISWRINARDVAHGVGKTKVSFTTGDIGSQTNIVVDLETIEGQILSKNITLTSSKIDLLWEAKDSYVPPFYKGKALGTREGTFKVVAMPNIIVKGEKVSANNLSYTWKKNGNGQPSSSGWGKSFFSFKNSFLDEENELEVRIGDIYENEVGKESITIPMQKPKIVFYKKDSTLNTELRKSLGSNAKISKDGVVIMAIPYFFSTKMQNFDDLKFSWLADGKEVITTYPKNEISVVGAEGKSGSGTIKLIIENENTLFQSSERLINVDF